MNALTVLYLAAVTACSRGQLLAYPGVYSYPGVLGAYPPLLSHPAPVTVKNVAPYKVTFKTVAPAPVRFKTVAPAPIAYKAVAPAPVAPVTVKAVAPTPLTYNVAPFAPVAPVKTQYHAQDELGQYSFGYAGGPSSRTESRDAFGVVRGSYNYVDSEGKLQTQHYVADALGYRVAGTNLPVATVTSEAVQDTPEVAAQKATLKAAHEETATATETKESRKKRSVVATPTFYSPLRFSYGFHAPLHYSQPAIFPNHFPYSATFPAATTYSAVTPGFTAYTGAPAVTTYTAAAPGVTTYTAAAQGVARDADLLKVVHNPGHATSYRVD